MINNYNLFMAFFVSFLFGSVTAGPVFPSTFDRPTRKQETGNKHKLKNRKRFMCDMWWRQKLVWDMWKATVNCEFIKRKTLLRAAKLACVCDMWILFKFMREMGSHPPPPPPFATLWKVLNSLGHWRCYIYCRCIQTDMSDIWFSQFVIDVKENKFMTHDCTAWWPLNHSSAKLKIHVPIIIHLVSTGFENMVIHQDRIPWSFGWSFH